MKKYITIFSIMFLTVAFLSSCEKLKSLADVEFDANFESELNVPIQPTSLKSTQGSFNKTETIDPLSNAEFQKYQNKIKNINVTQAEITILEPNPSSIVVSSATLSAMMTNMPTASWSISNETLTDGKKIILDNNQQQFDKLRAIINEKKPFDVNLQGVANVDQGSFKVKVKFKTRVKANPLN